MVRFGGASPPEAHRKTPEVESPIQEFNQLVNQIERYIAEAREEHVKVLLTPPPPPPPAASPRGGGLWGLIPRRQKDDKSPKHMASGPVPIEDGVHDSEVPPHPPLHPPQDEAPDPAPPVDAVGPSPGKPHRRGPKRRPGFASLPVEGTVEALRRIAELVVTGENYTTSLHNQERAKLERLRDRWKSRDILEDLQATLEVEDEDQKDVDVDADMQEQQTAEEYMQLFDLFFERQVLDTIISLLTGAAFRLTPEETQERQRIHEMAALASLSLSETATSKDAATAGDNMELRSPDQNNDCESNEVFANDLKGDLPTTMDRDLRQEHLEMGKPTDSEDLEFENGHAAGSRIDNETDVVHADEDRKASHIEMHNHYSGPSMLDEPILIPPIEVATQALQSVSILIQNVSRATSLFIILSNNRINELISMPLDFYAAGLRRERGTGLITRPNPELLELTTHFVTFLKSLALRMNAQTLQFFLKYPEQPVAGGDAVPASSLTGKRDSVHEPLNGVGLSQVHGGLIDGLHVEFLLYERALDFCAATHESFVRTTALNICLNTLRLASVMSTRDDGGSEHFDLESKTPSGVLHDIKSLPFRERLAIALFTCIPSRVDLLVSPICTKLAEKWALLDEQIREMDLQCQSPLDLPQDGSDNAALERAHEIARREKMVRSFRERTSDLLDELHLLNDVFSVGLTVLNEQIIEMLFATFVYPLLLLPLRNYSRRLSLAKEEMGPSFDVNPFGADLNDFSDAAKDLSKVAGPAKTALVTLALLFNTVDNLPFMKLVYTAIFHPLSPDTSSLPTLRSRLEVVEMENEKQLIRLDSLCMSKPSERSTYNFGRNRNSLSVNESSNINPQDNDDREASIFVLSPALADVLEISSEGNPPHKLSTPNAYRHALLTFLDAPDAVSDVRKLAVIVFDAAHAVINNELASEILLNTDLYPVEGQSLSNSPKGIINGLCQNVVRASKVAESVNEWGLRYDEIAAHALVCVCRNSSDARALACEALEHLIKKSFHLVASYSFEAASPMGGSEIRMIGAPSINAPDYDDQIAAAMKNLVIYESIDANDDSAVVQRFLHISDRADGYLLLTTCGSDFNSLCGAFGSFLTDAVPSSKGALSEREEIQFARSSFSTMLRCHALYTLMTFDDLVVDGASFSGFAVTCEGRVVDSGSSIDKIHQQIYSPISRAVQAILFQENDAPGPEEGATISLESVPFVTCVCQVAAAFSGLFAAGNSGLADEGGTWQSLYLAVLDGFMLVLNPRSGDTGAVQGIIVSVCRLEHLSIRADNYPPDNGSAARCLVFTHEWYDRLPPLLFLFDAIPQVEKHGPFIRSKPLKSTLDVWFENQSAADLALDLFSRQIFAAKVERGRRVIEALSTAL